MSLSVFDVYPQPILLLRLEEHEHMLNAITNQSDIYK